MDNISELIKWAEKSLSANGYIIQGAVEDIQTTAWSIIKRFATSKGYIYLKQTSPLLPLEPIIIKILADRFHASVPKIIDINKSLNCFLMADSGKLLRDHLKEKFQPDLLSQAIEQYIYIQSAATDHINTFLALGVPDWRLKRLPIFYEQLIDQEELLKKDGLSNDEINALHQLHPTFVSMCDLLSTFRIPETLDHCDFHDNNVLIDTYNATIIIDWGETVITHPFFSLITFLNQAALHYDLKPTDPTYIKLQETCLEGWIGIIPEQVLLEAFLLTKQLWPVYSALGFYRLMTSSDKKMFDTFYAKRSGRFAQYFKAFIKDAES